MVKDFPKDSDSSIYKARIREEDLASQGKLQEIQGAADELARQSIINKLRQAEIEHEKLKLKLEQEASGKVEDILSYVELSAAENEDNFTSGIDALLSKLFRFFNFMDSELGVEADPQVYSIIKERHKEKEEAWLAAIIKFLRDKFNKLIKAIFSRDLSFGEKIDQEIERLFKRLFNDDLSQEEEVAILERLEALRNLKLKLQIFAVGSIIAMFAELFSVELTASVETTKDEEKKAEKTSAKEKEATKEVEIIEIKVDMKEKPLLVVPNYLLDFSSGFPRPITLTKPELDLLSDSLKNLMRSVHNYDMNKGNSGVKETKVKEGENKQAKSEEPKKEVYPTTLKQLEVGQMRDDDIYRCDSEWKEVKSKNDSNTYRSALNQPHQEFIFNRKAPGQSVESSVANDKCDFGLRSNASAKNGPKRSSASNAQENLKSKFTDVVKERIGNQSVRRNGEKTGISR